MNYGQAFERLMGMNDTSWKRHANPWSGWTRMLTLPILTIAIWSRVWIGDLVWFIIGLVAVWIWVNPRLFREPKSTDNWMSKGVLGERVWLNRKSIPIPAHHARAANILSAISALALGPYVWGLWQLEIWPALGGMAVVVLAKLWFLDRMVWLFEDMRKVSDDYASWLRTR